MSMRMSELNGSGYSTPTNSRYSSRYGSFNDSQPKKTNELSTESLSKTLSSSMKKQTTKSELFDIELEDYDFFKADQIIEEINMLSAKSFAYAQNSGLTSTHRTKSNDGNEDSETIKVGFIPLKPTPTKTKSPKLEKFNLTGKSYFSEPHIYPQKNQNENYPGSQYNGESEDNYPSYEFFRATPVRNPPKLI